MRELPDGWRVVKLGEVCEINPSRPSLSRGDDEPTTFIPMSAIGERSGSIEKPEVRRFGEVRKGYTYLEESDVLFAKITPCMQNGKHAIARDLIGGFGFGTTELHVLRPGSEIIAEWIHAYVRQPAILEAATEYFTGTVGQQRLPEEFLKSLEVPLPPLLEQRRIAAVLREQMAAVDAARRSAEVQLEAAQALPAAYLRATFDSAEAQQWPRKFIHELISSRILVEHQDGNHGELHPRNKDFVPSGVKFVTAKHVQDDGGVALEEAPSISQEQASGLRIGFAKAGMCFSHTMLVSGRSVWHRPSAIRSSWVHH